MPFPGLFTFPGPASFPGRSRFRFTPPFIIRDHVIEGALRASLQYGITVMRIGGEWAEAEFPSWEQESSADLLFRGGHVHDVDADTAGALVAAGYEVVETIE